MTCHSGAADDAGSRSSSRWQRRARTALITIILGLSASAPAAAEDAPAQIYRNNVGSVVQFDIVRRDGRRLTATGFVVEPGVVATNAHVVRDFGDGQVYYGSPARRSVIDNVLASRPEVDLALVSIRDLARQRVKPLELARETRGPAVRIGDPVYVIGNPGGLTNSFAEGMLSGRRKLEGHYTLQLTVSATHGSSGSPVLDRAGRVVGIVRSTAIKGTDIVLATPVSYLHEMLRSRGRPSHIARRSAIENVRTREAGVPAQPRPLLNDHARRRSGDPTRTTTRIVIGAPDWVSVEATAHILKAAIESRFPYEVALRRGSNAQILAEIAAEDGYFDIHAEVWLPNHRDLWDTYGRNRHNVRTTEDYTAFQGLCTNGPVAKRHGIRHVDDLRDPEIAKLFDTNGDGKGDVWLGDAGWSATDINNVKMRDYGLNAHYGGFGESEDSFLPRLEQRLAENRPTLFYCYLPHWLSADYDIVAVDEPPHSDTCFHVAAPELDDNWFENSVARCRGPSSTVRIVYAARLEEKAPGVARFLSRLSLSASLVSDWTSLFKHNDAPPYLVAKHWVSRHPFFADPGRFSGR